MTTAGQIIDRALRPMRDPNMDFFPPEEMLEYVNEAQNDLALRQQLIVGEVSANVVGGALTIADDQVAGWRWLKDASGKEVTWVSPSVLFNLIESGEGAADVVYAAAIGNEVQLLNAVDGQTYTGGYRGLPSQVDDTADVLDTPLVYDDKLVRYVRAQCYFRLGELELGQLELAQYNQGLSDPSRSFATLTRPGHPTSSVAATFVDLDPERMS